MATVRIHLSRAENARDWAKYFFRHGKTGTAWIWVIKASCHCAAASGKLCGPAVYAEAPDGTDIGIKRSC